MPCTCFLEPLARGQAGSLNCYSPVLRAGRRREEGVIAQGWLINTHPPSLKVCSGRVLPHKVITCTHSPVARAPAADTCNRGPVGMILSAAVGGGGRAGRLSSNCPHCGLPVLTHGCPLSAHTWVQDRLHTLQGLPPGLFPLLFSVANLHSSFQSWIVGREQHSV